MIRPPLRLQLRHKRVHGLLDGFGSHRGLVRSSSPAAVDVLPQAIGRIVDSEHIAAVRAVLAARADGVAAGLVVAGSSKLGEPSGRTTSGGE